jgi:ketosteroid isomerase-like protein
VLEFTLCALLLLSAAAVQSAGAGKDVAATIIAIERAALDRSDRGDVNGFLEITDEDIVYFDPSLERPIHGLPALRAYYSKDFGNEQTTGVMSNAKVQASDDMAVLTFNYASKRANGNVVCWNCTEVYRLTRAGWRIIQTHWSYAKPPKETK